MCWKDGTSAFCFPPASASRARAHYLQFLPGERHSSHGFFFQRVRCVRPFEINHKFTGETLPARVLRTRMGGLILAINEPFGTPNAEKLRELAAWYREFAERSGSGAISESRLRIAAELEEEADLLEEGKTAG